jgi:hypothetical protein
MLFESDFKILFLNYLAEVKMFWCGVKKIS